MTEKERIERIGESLGLTPKESAIIALIHAEHADKVIVSKEGVKRTTLRTHLARASAKLGTKTRVGMALKWEKALSSFCADKETTRQNLKAA